MYSYGSPTHGRAKARTTSTNVHSAAMWRIQVVVPEDLPRAMNDREEWAREVSGISVLPARYDDDDEVYKNTSHIRIKYSHKILNQLVV